MASPKSPASPATSRPKWVLDWFLYFAGLPVAGFGWFLGIRFVVLSAPGVIGHLAAEIDFFMRKWRRGDFGPIKPVLIVSRRRVVNTALLAKAAEHIFIVRNKTAVRVLRPLSAYRFLQVDVRHAVMTEQGCPYHALRAATANAPPSLTLSDQDRVQGRQGLAALGVPPHRWLVAVHARESGYGKGRFPHRNASLSSFLLAVDEIVARGGWCLRMGDASMSPAPEHYGLIDYAHSPLKSDFMDVFICAESRFFLGCASGLSLVPTLFGKPTVVAHMVPLSAALPPDADSISVPKLMRSADRQLLTFAQMAALNLKTDIFDELLLESRVEIMESDPLDIRDACLEMIAKLEGVEEMGAAEELLQNRFRAHLKASDYCTHSAARVSDAFLRKYEFLL